MASPAGPGIATAAAPQVEPRVAYLNDAAKNDHLIVTKRYAENVIVTSKYTIVSFVPKTIFEFFRVVANIYFLLISLLQPSLDESVVCANAVKLKGSADVGDFIVNFFTFLILYNNLVPISLYVSLDIIKVLQSHYMTQDDEMMDDEFRAIVRTSDLNEELGQVEYIFSDKTGTLTRNIMEFRNLCTNKTFGLFLGGTVFYSALLTTMKVKVVMLTLSWNKYHMFAMAFSFWLFFLFLIVYPFMTFLSYDMFGVTKMMFNEDAWNNVLLVAAIAGAADASASSEPLAPAPSAAPSTAFVSPFAALASAVAPPPSFDVEDVSSSSAPVASAPTSAPSPPAAPPASLVVAARRPLARAPQSTSPDAVTSSCSTPASSPVRATTTIYRAQANNIHCTTMRSEVTPAPSTEVKCSRCGHGVPPHAVFVPPSSSARPKLSFHRRVSSLPILFTAWPPASQEGGGLAILRASRPVAITASPLAIEVEAQAAIRFEKGVRSGQRALQLDARVLWREETDGLMALPPTTIVIDADDDSEDEGADHGKRTQLQLQLQPRDSDTETESESESALRRPPADPVQQLTGGRRRRRRRSTSPVASRPQRQRTDADAAPQSAPPRGAWSTAPPSSSTGPWNNVLTLLTVPHTDTAFVSPFAALVQHAMEASIQATRSRPSTPTARQHSPTASAAAQTNGASVAKPTASARESRARRPLQPKQEQRQQPSTPRTKRTPSTIEILSSPEPTEPDTKPLRVATEETVQPTAASASSQSTATPPAARHIVNLSAINGRRPVSVSVHYVATAPAQNELAAHVPSNQELRSVCEAAATTEKLMARASAADHGGHIMRHPQRLLIRQRLQRLEQLRSSISLDGVSASRLPQRIKLQVHTELTRLKAVELHFRWLQIEINATLLRYLDVELPVQVRRFLGDKYERVLDLSIPDVQLRLGTMTLKALRHVKSTCS
ncbi:hypothetical protein P43SY_000740 [Pythium insidiosum]|uniref:P-type sodium-transporting ATPase4 n=1 Tax=Pythium insidiosum TaxID=114742 RepID=A0AAD5LT19_PYTIN|nr:hypothetical protein P43SY_000740 [Pythium insidiosum]